MSSAHKFELVLYVFLCVRASEADISQFSWYEDKLLDAGFGFISNDQYKK